MRYPFQTDIRGLASYTIPRIDVQVATTWQSRPGPELAANWVVPNAIVIQSLGRPLSGGAANMTVNLLNPGQMYGDRVNQLDLRFAKILRFGRTSTNIGIDIYNVTNSSVDADLQHHVRDDVAAAELLHAGPVGEGHRSVQFLITLT